MSWSLGEARALAVKAARGAGMPWGLAEEAGFSVYQLQRVGAPGIRAMAAYLTLRSDSRFETLLIGNEESTSKSDGAFCPIQKGACVQDAGNVENANIGNVFFPILLLPFLPQHGALTFSGHKIWISKNEFLCYSGFDALLVEQAVCEWKTGVHDFACATQSRVPDSEQKAMDKLSTFAAKTYAPATEQSRLAGAGAGLNDND